jgi:hypothetical protein
MYLQHREIFLDIHFTFNQWLEINFETWNNVWVNVNCVYRLLKGGYRWRHILYTQTSTRSGLKYHKSPAMNIIWWKTKLGATFDKFDEITGDIDLMNKRLIYMKFEKKRVNTLRSPAPLVCKSPITLYIFSLIHILFLYGSSDNIHVVLWRGEMIFYFKEALFYVILLFS